LCAAVIVWATALLMSPHSDDAAGTEHVRITVAHFLQSTAIGTLVLGAIAAWLLFPERRPRKPVRDWALLAVIAILTVSSLYQLIWLKTAIFN
jgi:hypothetical protein